MERRLLAARNWTGDPKGIRLGSGLLLLRSADGRRIVLIHDGGRPPAVPPELPPELDEFLKKVAARALAGTSPGRRVAASWLPKEEDCLLVARAGEIALHLRCPSGEREIGPTTEYGRNLRVAFAIPTHDARALIRIGGSHYLRVIGPWVLSQGKRGAAFYRMEGEGGKA